MKLSTISVRTEAWCYSVGKDIVTQAKPRAILRVNAILSFLGLHNAYTQAHHLNAARLAMMIVPPLRV